MKIIQPIIDFFLRFSARIKKNNSNLKSLEEKIIEIRYTVLELESLLDQQSRLVSSIAQIQYDIIMQLTMISAATEFPKQKDSPFMVVGVPDDDDLIN
jgi:hypothetical protein